MIYLLVAILIYIVSLTKKTGKAMTTEDRAKTYYTPKDAEESIIYAREKYCKQFDEIFEKIMRLETSTSLGAFTSLQYKTTGTAGMEAGNWIGLPKDISTVQYKDNQTGKMRKFIVFPTGVKGFADYFYKYVQRNNGNYLNWNSRDPETQKRYAEKLSLIKTKIA